MHCNHRREKKNYAIRCSRNLIVCCCFYFFLSKRITSTKNDKCNVSTRRTIISRFHCCNRCRRVQFVSFLFIIIIIVIIFHLNFFLSHSVNAIQFSQEENVLENVQKKPSSLLKRSLKSMCNANGKKTAKIIFSVAIWFLSIHLWYAQPSFGVDCCCFSTLVNMQKQFVFQSCMTRKQIAPDRKVNTIWMQKFSRPFHKSEHNEWEIKKGEIAERIRAKLLENWVCIKSLWCLMYWHGNTLRYFLSTLSLSRMRCLFLSYCRCCCFHCRHHCGGWFHCCCCRCCYVSVQPDSLFISNDKWNNSLEPSTMINHCNSDLPLN